MFFEFHQLWPLNGGSTVTVSIFSPVIDQKKPQMHFTGSLLVLSKFSFNIAAIVLINVHISKSVYILKAHRRIFRVLLRK